MRMDSRWSLSFFLLLACTIHTSAAAERLDTFWLLSRDSEPSSRYVPQGTSIVDQRLLPARLVRTVDVIQLQGKEIPAGTYMYMVLSSKRQIGYCTLKDFTLGNQARTLFIPVLDKRPCFLDVDNDGRFDKTFSVYDQYGGPPTAHGSMNKAVPLTKQSQYALVERSQFPLAMDMALSFSGSNSDITKTKLKVMFKGNIKQSLKLGQWNDISGVTTSRGTLFDVGSVMILLQSIDASGAKCLIEYKPDVFLSADGNNNIFWAKIPSLK